MPIVRAPGEAQKEINALRRSLKRRDELIKKKISQARRREQVVFKLNKKLRETEEKLQAENVRLKAANVKLRQKYELRIYRLTLSRNKISANAKKLRPLLFKITKTERFFKKSLHWDRGSDKNTKTNEFLVRFISIWEDMKRERKIYYKKFMIFATAYNQDDFTVQDINTKFELTGEHKVSRIYMNRWYIKRNPGMINNHPRKHTYYLTPEGIIWWEKILQKIIEKKMPLSWYDGTEELTQIRRLGTKNVRN